MRLRLRSKFSGGDPGRKMPVGTRELASSGKRTDLYRWKRFSKKPNPKHGFDSENLEYWTKRVEKASEFAVSEVFFPRNSDVPRKPWGKVIDLESREQLVDHDETHEEAQKLLNDWMNSKLKMELTSDKEDNGDTVPNVTSSPGENGVSDPVKYEKFDDLCGHLEEEEESTTVKQFINHLLHKDIVDSGILEDLGIKENQEKKKHKDPRLTMEMRHKQVGGKWRTGNILCVTHLMSFNKDVGFVMNKGTICDCVRVKAKLRMKEKDPQQHKNKRKKD